MTDEERFPIGYLDEVIPWRYKFQRLWRFVTLYYRRHPAFINPPPPPSWGGGEAGVREPRRPRPTPSAASAALTPPLRDD